MKGDEMMMVLEVMIRCLWNDDDGDDDESIQMMEMGMAKSHYVTMSTMPKETMREEAFHWMTMTTMHLLPRQR